MHGATCPAGAAPASGTLLQEIHAVRWGQLSGFGHSLSSERGWGTTSHARVSPASFPRGAGLALAKRGHPSNPPRGTKVPFYAHRSADRSPRPLIPSSPHVDGGTTALGRSCLRLSGDGRPSNAGEALAARAPMTRESPDCRTLRDGPDPPNSRGSASCTSPASWPGLGNRARHMSPHGTE